MPIFVVPRGGQLLLEPTRDSGNIRSGRNMNRITPKRVAVFVGVMALVAFIVYLPHYGREQRQAQEVMRQQRTAENKAVADVAAQKAATEHAQFLARYVDTTFTKKPGGQTVALSVASDDGKSYRSIQDALLHRFQAGTVQLLPSFFKPSFVSDGLFAGALNGSDEVSKKLELAKYLDEMLLARATVEYSTNGPDLENVITATMRLDVTLIPVTGNIQGQTWTFTAAGAGFSQTAAQTLAEERLTKQIAEDKKMSL